MTMQRVTVKAFSGPEQLGAVPTPKRDHVDPQFLGFEARVR